MVSLVSWFQQIHFGAAFLGYPLLFLKAELVGVWDWWGSGTGDITAADALRLGELQLLNCMLPVWGSTEGSGEGAGYAFHEGRSSLAPKNSAKGD